ncbi:glycoside hydrolase family 2 TIM barrel-domain containing protein [Sediminicola luteus]|uniref:glycoside hydrolase family 2 TIM barrel-domain containing protein n=1 Tax=Sediminicola luteus TaxID=319238 RepID=UPI0015574014|nr:glycoside hydrolase family 2 TIM barrel-domain containing protein [Sediminicola luteus]
MNDTLMGTQDALGTPHIHKLEGLKPGDYTIRVEVDNRMIHNIGDKGHAYGAYTQSIWNGMVGRIELWAKDPYHINDVRIYPDITNDQLKLVSEVSLPKAKKVSFAITIRNLATNAVVYERNFKQRLQAGKHILNKILPMERRLQPWSEFDPQLYGFALTMKSGNYHDSEQREFGFVEYGHDGTKILVNGSPVFLRGNLDCVHFPLTGYASASLDDWIQIFETYKSYGLNHARFHSWCPPEAAFRAANRVGIYLQAEASIWIDWWMSKDMVSEGRPEMDTRGHPKGLGYDSLRDAFVIDEMNRVVDTYGNHPSFSMFCIGNELGNSNFKAMAQWVSDLKKKDPRRLYSVSTARTITPTDDYMATHYIPEIGRTRGLRSAGTDWDFEAVYAQMDIPIIAHEIGQWPVYPTWNEIDSYSGVLKARNFEQFRALAEKNGTVNQDQDFRMASGALNQMMYKYEVESFLRTPSCAGVQLLSMQDYQGQGEALIGWLDAHWNPKGITTPEQFRQHFSETVPLMRTPKFVWDNSEVFTARLQMAHYGAKTLPEGKLVARILTENDSILLKHSFDTEPIAVGSLVDIGVLNLPFSGLEQAQKIRLQLQWAESDIQNEWELWVFPKNTPELPNTDVWYTDTLDETALAKLHQGGKVLLAAHGLGSQENSVAVNFYPLYWSLTFFPGQGKTSIGMLVQDQHPVFDHFPTDAHSDWQWEPFDKNTTGFVLNELPAKYKPLVQVVDDFHRNNKEGVIFEFKVGKGKLLVSGFNIRDHSIPGASQLEYSLLKYMDSDAFSPDQNISAEFLKGLFTKMEEAQGVKLDGTSDKTLLQVGSAGKLNRSLETLPWKPELDSVAIRRPGTQYTVKAQGVWKDSLATAWHGEEMVLDIECPKGLLGSLYVWFHDWNQQERKGLLEFEGRKLKLGAHDQKEGKWVKFHIMREDSNDGKLRLKTKSIQGGNLMIREIRLEVE